RVDHFIRVLVSVQDEAKQELSLIVEAGGVCRFQFGPAQRRQQQGCKDRDEGDHHQQFNESEAAPPSGGARPEVPAIHNKVAEGLSETYNLSSLSEQAVSLLLHGNKGLNLGFLR